MAYCRWLSQRLVCTVTLPTEQQWERAARCAEGREWPWASDWDVEKANAVGHLGRTSLVGHTDPAGYLRLMPSLSRNPTLDPGHHGVCIHRKPWTLSLG